MVVAVRATRTTKRIVRGKIERQTQGEPTSSLDAISRQEHPLGNIAGQRSSEFESEFRLEQVTTCRQVDSKKPLKKTWSARAQQRVNV